jgi:hypothetical protein
MKMKWIGFFLFATLIGCEKSINITTPTILIEDVTLSVAKQVTIRVEEYADIDGSRVKADYFEWTVEDSKGTIVKSDFKDSSIVYWVPENAGYFIVKVKIGYDQNKSITALKEVNVYESTGSLKKKITGHWKGTGTRRYDNGEWGIDLYIDSTGHYYGTADFYSFDPYCEKGVFNSGRLDYYKDNVGDSCGVPGDIPCQRLEINNVENNVGSGVAWIGWIYYNNGIFISQNCTDVYDIEDLVTTNEGKKLYFEFNDRGSNDYYEWIMKFDLVKQ